MFTGIIEAFGAIKKVVIAGSNKTFWVESSISHELKVDQSVSHNGVCLTVESVTGEIHAVTAIEETLKKTNLGTLQEGDLLNLERCMIMNGRLLNKGASYVEPRKIGQSTGFPAYEQVVAEATRFWIQHETGVRTRKGREEMAKLLEQARERMIGCCIFGCCGTCGPDPFDPSPQIKNALLGGKADRKFIKKGASFCIKAFDNSIDAIRSGSVEMPSLSGF